MTQISAGLYKELLDRMSDGVYFVDQNRRILYWNDLRAVVAKDLNRPDDCAVGLANGLHAHVDRHAATLFVAEKDFRVAGSAVAETGEQRTALKAEWAACGIDVAESIVLALLADDLIRLVAGEVRCAFVRVAQRTGERVGDLNESAIAAGMAEAVVDRFEAVNVEHQHAEGIAVRLILEEGGADRHFQESAVGLMGERIDESEALHGFGLAADIVNREILRELAERCAVLIEQTCFRNEQGNLEELSISVGMALVRPDDDVDTLIARADARMYAEKKTNLHGRREPQAADASDIAAAG